MLEITVLIGLAAYRAARLLAFDTLLDGPRHWLFLRFPPKDDYYRKSYRISNGTWQVGSTRRDPTFLGQLLACVWCSSVWIAGAITVALAVWWTVPDPVLVWGAACSVAGICGTLTA